MSATRLDAERIRHVARLARLSLTDAEVERLAAEIPRVLDYVERLAGIGLPSHEIADDTAGTLREDVETGSTDRGALLQNAPVVERAHVLVPGVLRR